MRLALLLLAALVGACVHMPPAPPLPPRKREQVAATLVIRDARVFDGERLWPRASVAIAGDAIVAFDRDLDLAGRPEVIDGAGLTLMPGLIDAGTHAYARAHLQQALAFGVTTEIDAFNLPHLYGPLRALVAGEDGRGLADFRTAGIRATASGAADDPALPTLSKPEEAAGFVDDRLSEGSDYIMIVLDDDRPLGADTLRALVAAAHARNRVAVVQVRSQRGAIAAIEAGADGLSHVFYDSAPTRQLIKLAAEREVFVADNLVMLATACDQARGPALANDPEIRPLLGPAAVQALERPPPGPPLAKEQCAHATAVARELHRAGVPLLASTDAPNIGTVHGASLHDELAVLVAAGLSPTAALTAATAAPARAFALADRGRIAAGMRADLVLVRGDPTVDITATRAIVGVWKAGVRLDREPLVAAARDEHAAVAARRTAPPPDGSQSGLISDFEDGALLSRFGAGWFDASDADAGGKSTVFLTAGVRKAPGSKRALKISGTVAAAGGGRSPYAGAIFFPGRAPMEPANLSRFRRLTFWARGDGSPTLTVTLVSAQLRSGAANKAIPLTDRWAHYTVELAELAPIEWYDLAGLMFASSTQPGPFVLELDDVRLE